MNTKRILLFAMALLFLPPAVCSANYYIVMRSGSRMLVDQYWEQDNKISFYYQGDLVEFPKTVVKEIKETNEALPAPSIAALPPPPPAATAKEKVIKPSDSGAKGAAETKVKDNKGAKQAPEAKGEKAAEEEPCVPGAKDANIDSEFKLLSNRYAERYTLEREDLISLTRQLITWRDTILKKRLGNIYRDEIQKAYTMCEDLESMVRK